MKTQAKDAVALAMDWLAQLRDEDSAEPPPGDGEPAIDSAPPAGDFGDVPPAVPPADGGILLRPRHPRSMGGCCSGRATRDRWGDARPAAPRADWEMLRPRHRRRLGGCSSGRAACRRFGHAAPAVQPAADPWPPCRPRPLGEMLVASAARYRLLARRAARGRLGGCSSAAPPAANSGSAAPCRPRSRLPAGPR